MLYMVTVTPGPKTDLNRVAEVLEPAHHWYRYALNAWVVCTNETAGVWNKRLAPIIKPVGSVVIARLDPNADRQGWQPVAFWDWCNEHEKHWQGILP